MALRQSGRGLTRARFGTFEPNFLLLEYAPESKP
jgi:hypothetical protein